MILVLVDVVFPKKQGGAEYKNGIEIEKQIVEEKEKRGYCNGSNYLFLVWLYVQVLNRCLEPKQAEVPPQCPLVSPVAPVTAQVPPVAVPILPQHVITSGTRKDCIRLRGLPYEAQVEHILEFLGEHAKNIVYQGVHMVYNAQVRE